ncbi:uncharacterized protein [Epargyreus clarus]|uniref:uncharacterized protein n=1 Tax=Epargyreus clarus TaxID=520877 RepID=UPI003C307D29
MVPQQYCLRWKHHHSNVQSMFAQLLEKERFCDVTLYCSPNFATQVPNKDTVDPQNIRGVSLRAHRVVLAACSELLAALLAAHEAHGEPVLVLDGAEPRHLRALLDYMYTGEMNVHHSQLASLLKTAEELRIKGLTDIRWNNKDEPPDCNSGVVTTTTNDKRPSPERKPEPKHSPQTPKMDKQDRHDKEERRERRTPERPETKEEEERQGDKYSVNGGPPPLIKLPTREKSSPIKRENSDTDSPSPKRQRLISEHTDEEMVQPKSERDRDSEWQHGNLDITAERVSWAAAAESDEEWEHAPADIGSFLHTRLKVDGDNSADEESDDSTPTAPHAASSSSSGTTLIDLPKRKYSYFCLPNLSADIPGSKTSPPDPRFMDVVKLNDYLQHGRRPQFWEENYVKRVMEAVRIKELEMKQAAEILGVSYGTLYGRYRDVYGCINRPYRTARDFWQAKGPSEVLERLQRGDLALEAAALALGVNPAHLATYVSDLGQEKDFEPVPIEVDPSLKGLRPRTYSTGTKKAVAEKKKVTVGGVADDEPTSVAAAIDKSQSQPAPSESTSGKWPSIRVASLDSLRGEAASPSPLQLMRTRPDLTIVAARRDRRDDDAA